VDVESHGSSPGKDRKNVVIVGRLSKIKGLWNLVPIIQELKTVNFEFVGDVRDSEGEAVKLELMKCCNVIFRGALDRKNTLQTIGAGKALLNTSPREGFPNTFIEAWALGTPVISLTVDPGGLLTSQHLGYVCNGDANKLKGLLLQDTYDLDTARIRQYVEDHFSMTYVAEEFERIFQQCS
jgi:glycosyltransferase involved in cell wall biosynthesis